MANLILAVNSDVMQDPHLDLLDKLILSYILNWEERNLSCFAKDGFLAALFGVPECEVTYSLIKLETLQFIEQIRGTGGRLIRSKKQQTKLAPVQEKDVFDI
jgi:hypothetical protein